MYTTRVAYNGHRSSHTHCGKLPLNHCKEIAKVVEEACRIVLVIRMEYPYRLAASDRLAENGEVSGYVSYTYVHLLVYVVFHHVDDCEPNPMQITLERGRDPTQPLFTKRIKPAGDLH